MKKVFFVLIVLLLFTLLPAYTLTEAEKIDIQKKSDNWAAFEDSMDIFYQSQPIPAVWITYCNTYLETQVNLTQQDAILWWDDNGWYEEPDQRWIWFWSAWYTKFREKWNGAGWAINTIPAADMLDYKTSYHSVIFEDNTIKWNQSKRTGRFKYV